MIAAEILPHTSVVTRLGVSPIHGIGVFAIASIPAGVNPFVNDQRPIRWITASTIEDLAPGSPHLQFYLDFGVRHGNFIGCPETFDLQGTGWYVNEPVAGSQPNLIATSALDLITARDIVQGEELTVQYSSFSKI